MIENMPAVLGALGVVIGAVSTLVLGWQNRANKLDQRSALRLKQYEKWRPGIEALVSDLRTLLGRHRIAEPDGIDAALEFPPPDEVTTDDAR